jgi:hypothetical protein
MQQAGEHLMCSSQRQGDESETTDLSCAADEIGEKSVKGTIMASDGIIRKKDIRLLAEKLMDSRSRVCS